VAQVEQVGVGLQVRVQVQVRDQAVGVEEVNYIAGAEAERGVLAGPGAQKRTDTDMLVVLGQGLLLIQQTTPRLETGLHRWPKLITNSRREQLG